MLTHRAATTDDAPLLAELNHQLIRDEGHRNQMSVTELESRMKNWLDTDYRAVLFAEGSEIVSYALYRPEGDAAYLRQFFVCQKHRRRGIGRKAMAILLAEELSPFARVYLEVLAQNAVGQAFWRAVGFHDYATTMEVIRNPAHPRPAAL